MGIIKFYSLVVREALRHSVDLAQAVVFIILLLAGLIASGNPGIKPTIEAYDLGGWKTAALVLGSIVAVRLILAPYWLWKAANSRSVITPERSIDYKLVVHGFTSRNDKKKKAIQLIFILNNTSYFHAIRYEVEEVYAEIDGKTVEGDVSWFNKGETIPPTSKYNFEYPWIFLKSNKWIVPGTAGHTSIVFKYGAAGQPFTRRVRFAAPIVIEKDYIRFNATENTEEPL